MGGGGIVTEIQIYFFLPSVFSSSVTRFFLRFFISLIKFKFEKFYSAQC